MDNLTQKTLVAGALLLTIMVTGFWVSRSGKPINMIKMNIHKLIALGTAIFMGLIIYRATKGSSLTALEIGILVLGGILAVVTIITGGLASLGKPVQLAVFVHKIVPYLTILSTSLAFYLLIYYAS